MWDKLKAICLRSLTVAWSYALCIVSTVMMNVDSLAALLGDASFSEQVQSLIGADPKVLGKYLSIVAAITIASRLRGIVAQKVASP